MQWQWDLSASHDRIGDALIDQGKLDDALVSYRRGLEIAETLARRDPSHAGWQRDLAVSYHKIGSIEAIHDPGEARELLEKGRAIRPPGPIATIEAGRSVCPEARSRDAGRVNAAPPGFAATRTREKRDLIRVMATERHCPAAPCDAREQRRC